MSVDEISEYPRADTKKPPDDLNPQGSIPSAVALLIKLYDNLKNPLCAIGNITDVY